MTHGRDDAAVLVDARADRMQVLVTREVPHGPVTAHVEDDPVLVGVDLARRGRGRERGLDVRVRAVAGDEWLRHSIEPVIRRRPPCTVQKSTLQPSRVKTVQGSAASITV